MNTPLHPCHQDPALFGSVEGPGHPDVTKAKKLCADCSIRDACLTAGREGREWGIWGGESQPERGAAGFAPLLEVLPKVSLVKEPKKRKPPTPATCPSEAMYKVHRKRGEDPGPCGCREARRIARLEKRQAEREPRQLKPCPYAYARHLSRREDAEACGCADVYRAYRRRKDTERRERRKREK